MHLAHWLRRLWDYNHTEFFTERVLTSFDGFPINVCTSSNPWVARLTHSGKYGCSVVKCDLGISLCGHIVNYTGPHVGVRNDSRMWMEHPARRASMYPWEWALGDKAYVNCPEFICEHKRQPRQQLTPAQLSFNDMLQFYRGRNEHEVAAVKCGRAALHGQWRGSLAGLAAIVRIAVHLVALQSRMAGPRYDCYGPWPVCRNAIAAAHYP